MIFSAHTLLVNNIHKMPSGLKVLRLLIVNIIEHIDGKCHVVKFGMQEEDLLEHTNVRCHWSTTLICRPLCVIDTHDAIEHTHLVGYTSFIG